MAPMTALLRQASEQKQTRTLYLYVLCPSKRDGESCKNSNEHKNVLFTKYSLRKRIPIPSSFSTHNRSDQHQHCRQQTDSKCCSVISSNRITRAHGLHPLHISSSDVASERISRRTGFLKQHPPSNSSPSSSRCALLQRQQQLDVNGDSFPRSICSQKGQHHPMYAER